MEECKHKFRKVTYAECTFCGDMEEVSTMIRICPWEGKTCEGDILRVTRVECDDCDFADDWGEWVDELRCA